MKKVQIMLLATFTLLTAAAIMISIAAGSQTHTVYAEPEAPEGSIPISVPVAPNWVGTEREISTLSNNATGRPAVAVRPNGNEVTFLFPYQEDPNDIDSRDPYYVTYNAVSDSWSNPIQLFDSDTTPGWYGESAQMNIVYAAGTPFALWVERITPVTTFKERFILTAMPVPQSGVKPVAFIDASVFVGVLDPTMVYENGRIHIFWATQEDIFSQTQILHRMFDISGDSFNNQAIISSSNSDARQPDAAADSNGIIHLVWEQDDVTQLPNPQDIFYSRGVVSGSNVIWSAPLRINGGIKFSRSPVIAVHNGKVMVTFTQYDINDNDEERVWYRECTYNCTSAGNWSSLSRVSGALVNIADTDFRNVTSDLVFDPGSSTTHLFFDGQTGSNPSRIMTNNDCAGWLDSRVEVPTGTGDPVYFPSAAAHGSDLYLVYHKEFNEPTNNFQVWARRATFSCERSLYLPFASR